MAHEVLDLIVVRDVAVPAQRDPRAPLVERRLFVAPWPAVRPAIKVSVVIPAVNEASNIGWVLDHLPPVHEVLVVDGESQDDTVGAVLAVTPSARILVQPRRGKGDALRAGFAAATGDVIVMLDADGSMDPAEIPMFVSLLSHGFDVVKGSREVCGGGSTDLTAFRRLGNRGLVRAANALYRGRWSDMCYGYIAFRRATLPAMNLYADGFEIETQILTHAAAAGLRIAEVPSLELDRRNGTSNLRPINDGLRILRTMLRGRMSPTRERVLAHVAAHEAAAAG